MPGSASRTKRGSPVVCELHRVDPAILSRLDPRGVSDAVLLDLQKKFPLSLEREAQPQIPDVLLFGREVAAVAIGVIGAVTQDRAEGGAALAGEAPAGAPE